MNFNDPSKILTEIKKMEDASLPRSINRARRADLFNGKPPYTEEEKKENRIETNVNFLEGPNIIHNAQRQRLGAYLKKKTLFNVTLEDGPVHLKHTWESTITKNINKMIKKSRKYLEVQRSVNSSVVVHGLGPVVWPNSYSWCPEAIGLDEILFPTRSLVSMENLTRFPIKKHFTPWQLYRMTHGAKVDPAWNVPVADKLIKNALDNFTRATGQSDPSQNPEQYSEAIKENSGSLDSDAVDTIDAWDFYFLNDEADEKSWERRIVLISTCPDVDINKDFLFNSKGRSYAGDISQILHIDFGDESISSPFRIGSVRGLGHMLYPTCHLQNRLRCKFADAVFESMLWYFRNVTPEDRERLEMISLHHLGIIPEGVSFVPGNERHTINENLVVAALSQNRQIMSENSASFVRDVNDGTSQKMTASEALIRNNDSTALVGSMNDLLYTYKSFEFYEIGRRFCLPNSADPDVVKFREDCIQDGVPEEVLDVERWNIEPERTLGSGNKTVAVAQAANLMAVRNLLDPDPQRKVLHIYVEANTDDPDMADELVPSKKVAVTDAAHDANLAMGCLMQGMPVGLKEGINHIDYVETILSIMAEMIKGIEASGGMTTPEKVTGLQTAADHVAQHIQIIAQDPNEKERVANYGTALGNMMNHVKAYAQRIQEQQQAAGPQLTPEAQAKIESANIVATSQAQIDQFAAQGKEARNETKFAADQRRRDEKLAAEIREKSLRAEADIHSADLSTQAEIIRTTAKEQAQPPTQTP